MLEFCGLGPHSGRTGP